MQVGSRTSLQSELNVTPMIDVVLVLLIIFMVVTPKNERELPVVMPQELAEPQPPPLPGEEPVVVGVDAQGGLRLGETPVVDLAELRAQVAQALATRKDKVVFLEAQDDAPYETCVRAMDAARRGGARHVGLLSPAVPPPLTPLP